MYTLNKKHIGAICFTSALLLASASAYAKGIKKGHKPKAQKNYSLVFSVHTGKSYVSAHGIPSMNKMGSKTLNTKSLEISKAICKRIKLAGGFDYYSPVNIPAQHSSHQKTYGFSIPVTAQIYPLVIDNGKIQPYCGAGFQYNINVSPSNISPFSSEIDNPNSIVKSGTKFISIIFVQGVTFEVSTKIQISESLRFVPGPTKTLGVDIGIGYKLP